MLLSASVSVNSLDTLWIENGEIRDPVRNLRFNQSVLAMLAPSNVAAIGAPQRLSPQLMVKSHEKLVWQWHEPNDRLIEEMT